MTPATIRFGASRRSHSRSSARLASLPGVLLAIGAMIPVTACRIEPVNGSGSSASTEPDLTAQVQTILDTQATSWNRGDLDGFMSAYERSPETTYIGSTGVIRGFDAIRERYAPQFESGVVRGELRFAQLQARNIDTRFAIVTARYILERDDMIESTGPFTLVLMNVEGEWRIVHDQSAEDPKPE